MFIDELQPINPDCFRVQNKRLLFIYDKTVDHTKILKLFKVPIENYYFLDRDDKTYAYIIFSGLFSGKSNYVFDIHGIRPKVIKVTANDLEQKIIDFISPQNKKIKKGDQVLDELKGQYTLLLNQDSIISYNRFPPETIEGSLSTWQTELYEELRRDQKYEKIIWYVDPIGDNGKTYFAKFMFKNIKALVCNGESVYMVNSLFDIFDLNIGILVFDLDRDCKNKKSKLYEKLENLKNHKIRAVIVFSNFFPKLNTQNVSKYDVRLLVEHSSYKLTEEEVLNDELTRKIIPASLGVKTINCELSQSPDQWLKNKIDQTSLQEEDSLPQVEVPKKEEPAKTKASKKTKSNK